MRAAVEQLDDLVRRCERRRSTGERERLSDDIKSAALDMMVPVEKERHLILNKNRLNTYTLTRSERENSGCSEFQSGTAPMDVDSLTQAINSIACDYIVDDQGWKARREGATYPCHQGQQAVDCGHVCGR